MTTAENTAEMVMGAVEYKPDEYLSKPFTKQVLQSRLQKLLGRKSSLRDISNAMQKHDFALAIKLCDEQLSGGAKNKIELLKLKGELALRKCDFDIAMQSYDAVLNERDLPWARLGKAQVFYDMGKFEDAKNILEEMVKTNPNYVFAHDLLAKVFNQLGENKKSQELLELAASKSPKAVLRQKALAEVAFHNEDYDVSGEAYKRAVRIGKYSCYKSPDDYAGLARVHMKKDTKVEAIKTLSLMKKEFRSSNPNMRLQSAVHEINLYDELDKPEDSKKSLESVMGIFNENPAAFATETAMELAKSCYKHGLAENGDELLKHVVRNHHDNPDILNKVKQLLDEYNNDTNSDELISNTRDEVVSLNNQGVELATQGKLRDSISLFVKASNGMPENQTITLNTAQSLIMFMQKNGPFREFMEQTQYYLARAQALGCSNDKYNKLLNAFQMLSSDNKKPTTPTSSARK
jgi:tetratricopeptide (TPR) repeat protein